MALLGGGRDRLLATELSAGAGRLSVARPRRRRLLSAVRPSRRSALLAGDDPRPAAARRRGRSSVPRTRSTGTGLPQLAAGRRRPVHRLPVSGAYHVTASLDSLP